VFVDVSAVLASIRKISWRIKLIFKKYKTVAKCDLPPTFNIISDPERRRPTHK
jgi:hypothetical protein